MHVSLLTLVLIVVLIVSIGGIGWNRWYGPNPGPGPWYGGPYVPGGIGLIVLILLILLLAGRL